MKCSDLLSECIGFDWDEANKGKNWQKHQVTFWECEQIFFNQPLVIHDDEEHSEQEKRFYALGQTETNRCLFVEFTIRKQLLRVISARDMTKKERRIYRYYENEDSKI